METLTYVVVVGPTGLGSSHAASSATTETSGSTSFNNAKRTESLCLNVKGLPFGRKTKTANFDIESKRWRPGEHSGRSAVAP